MANELRNKRVAVLVDNGFEQSELMEPRKALQDAGATADVISPQTGKVKGWQHTNWGEEIPVDRKLDEAKPDEYDALLLPGGVMNPDKLRANQAAVPVPNPTTNQGGSCARSASRKDSTLSRTAAKSAPQ